MQNKQIKKNVSLNVGKMENYLDTHFTYWFIHDPVIILIEIVNTWQENIVKVQCNTQNEDGKKGFEENVVKIS